MYIILEFSKPVKYILEFLNQTTKSTSNYNLSITLSPSLWRNNIPGKILINN